MPEALLDVSGLRVRFGRKVDAVRGISLTVNKGETHCLVGESGCGKSVSALAIMGLLARGAVRSADRLRCWDCPSGPSANCAATGWR